ncbi:MAG: alpha-glucan family phosphorylase [Pyrinomonadaceae bacterium]|nr:alpha-glucan family phosphorylase [Pyrinomonadaceae bacterium]MCX7639346.1 alpha-glucan family phosphorylase [Pyrinomonadaceae bacterium]MDW8305238.1 alpha-glucan family phosphorylase [Acidobacteriota bacterium]
MKPLTEKRFLDLSEGVFLPENLACLDAISSNFYWSWHREGAELFRDLDPFLWESVEHNPRQLLKKIDRFLLWQKASDPEYVERVRRFFEEQEKYLAEPLRSFGRITPQNPVAYFCAEYGVHKSLPFYSGGLGILAGDHLKSASDMSLPLVAVGLLYRFGYFRQKITHDGWQEERYADVFGLDLPISRVTNEKKERIIVSVRIRQREVFAQAWLVRVGKVRLYLLDTNIPQNNEIDRYITGHLYGGNGETRIVQEKLLGIGGVRLLKALGIEPAVYHLNEGHSAFLTLELARQFLQENSDKTFDDAVQYVRQKCVFTTHTPVAAGNDVFPPELIDACFDKQFIDSLKLDRESFLALGRVNPEDKNEWFGMTPLALKMCAVSNGVSKKHGEVSRRLWVRVFKNEKVEDVPITYITNGVHPLTWIAPQFQALYEQYMGKNWYKLLDEPERWKEAVSSIPDEEIWKTHLLLKNLLIYYIRRKVFSSDTGKFETIHEHSDIKDFFCSEYLTIGFARRVVGYKRWTLILKDFERFLRIIDNPIRPVQIIFAGKAHPQDREAKIMLQNLISQNQNRIWLKRAVFIEDYDQDIARYLVQGTDVWLNVPRRPLEASGTSGQKAAMNGVLNLSILDGWWIEGFNGENGFSIGTLDDPQGLSDEEIDHQESNSLYEILENRVVPLFYETNEHGIPKTWVAKMKNAIQTVTPQFSSYRMLKDYIEKAYTRFTD